MGLEAFVGGVNLGPLADARGRIIDMVADDARMVVHHRAERFLVGLEVGLAASLQIPLDLEHDGHDFPPRLLLAGYTGSGSKIRLPVNPTTYWENKATAWLPRGCAGLFLAGASDDVLVESAPLPFG